MAGIYARLVKILTNGVCRKRKLLQWQGFAHQNLQAEKQWPIHGLDSPPWTKSPSLRGLVG